MGIKNKKLGAVLLSGLCCLAAISGCGEKEKPAPGKQPAQESEAAEGNLADAPASEEGKVGEFSTQDVNGEAYTQEMFADYDLTLVNIFATWCSPCMGEIPDLQELYVKMKDKGVNVVGIVLDAVDIDGNTSEETLETARLLAEYTGAEYPFLIPDAGNLNGRLSEVSAVPETFFVDREGKVVGETYTGSRSLEEWEQIVETELKGVSQ